MHNFYIHYIHSFSRKTILFATRMNAAGIYLFKVNDGSTRTRNESVQSLQWIYQSDVIDIVIVSLFFNFAKISHIVLVFSHLVPFTEEILNGKLHFLCSVHVMAMIQSDLVFSFALFCTYSLLSAFHAQQNMRT